MSLPRHTYAELTGHDTQDRINHAYVFDGDVDGYDGEMLNIPVDHYITINMQGVETLSLCGWWN